ncbi:hypothetical protein B0H10DRAFT_1945562 [Mycena sp. CBHHK59/15]|nr:hypothetical protein B0H10DRAFT_1945562 [Mycena sp. CBHHK59/15]
MPTTLAVQILERLLAHPSLKDNLQFGQIQRFLELTHRIWVEIVPPSKAQPVTLSLNIEGFLSAVLNLEPNIIQLTWHAFGDLAESSYNNPAQPSLDDSFHLHAQEFKISAETIAPPVSTCPRHGCHSASLSDKIIAEARLYTLRRGILPVFSKSLYCRSCYTRYYHNYFVQEAQNQSARPRVYNMALAASEILNASRLAHQLTGDLVLESFLLHAVLRDKSNRRETLFLPHHGPQNHRLDQVLAERNYRMVGTGQEMWPHACNRCMKLYQGEDGHWYQMTAGFHDGVTSTTAQKHFLLRGTNFATHIEN